MASSGDVADALITAKMILRVRSHLGTIRCEIEEEEELIGLRAKILAEWPELSGDCSWRLRKADASPTSDLLRSTQATQTIAAVGLKHGDLLYLDVTRCHTPSIEVTTAEAIPSKPSPKSYLNHASIYAFIRDNIAP